MFKAKEGVVGWGWLGEQRFFEQFKKNAELVLVHFLPLKKHCFKLKSVFLVICNL